MSASVNLKSAFLAQPEVARVLPFAVYLAVPALGGAWLPRHEYWLYLVKVMIVAGLVIWLRPRLPEMRWAFSWAAVGVGLAIAILWELASNYVPGLGRLFDHAQHLLLGKPLPPIHEPERWTPLVAFPHSPGLAYFFVAARVLGRSFLVPLVEEVFYRSFVYRYIISPKFESVSLSARHVGAWCLTSAFFGLAHPDQWLAGCLCGAAYQWLVLRSNRLGDAIFAHGLTNGLLSIWVIARGTWDFS